MSQGVGAGIVVTMPADQSIDPAAGGYFALDSCHLEACYDRFESTPRWSSGASGVNALDSLGIHLPP
jgi:hypothetical protein